MERKSNDNLVNSKGDFLFYANVYSSIKTNSLFNYLNFDNNQSTTYIGYLFNSQLPKIEERNNNIVLGKDKHQNLYESLSILNSGLLQATGLSEEYKEKNNEYFEDFEIGSKNPFLITSTQARNEFIDHTQQSNIELAIKNVQWANRLAKLAKYARNDVLYKYTNGNRRLIFQFSKLYTRLMLSQELNQKSDLKGSIIDSFMKDYKHHLETKEPLNSQFSEPLYNILKKEIQDNINYNEKYAEKYKNPEYTLETFYTYVSNQQAMETCYELKDSYTTFILKEYAKHKKEYDKKEYKIYTYIDERKSENFSRVLEILIPQYNISFSLHSPKDLIQNTCTALNLNIKEIQRSDIQHLNAPYIYKMKQEQIEKLVTATYDPFISQKDADFQKKYSGVIAYYKNSDLVKHEMERQNKLYSREPEITEKITGHENHGDKEQPTKSNIKEDTSFEDNYKTKSELREEKNKSNTNNKQKQKQYKRRKNKFSSVDLEKNRGGER